MYARISRQHHPAEPHWQRPKQLQPRPNHVWRQWLLDPGSLTDRLLECGESFQVKLLNQNWERPRPSEIQTLALAPRKRALVREVLLCVDNIPWVYGRSVFPVTSLTGPLRHLRHLSNRSLGHQLFRYPQLQRGPFELARIQPAHLPAAVAELCEEDQPLWARRSRFRLGSSRLLVSEVFLPAFSRSLGGG